MQTFQIVFTNGSSLIVKGIRGTSRDGEYWEFTDDAGAVTATIYIKGVAGWILVA